MPGTKRTTKTVHDDDDDFISTVDNNKKTRNTKSKDYEIESKSSTRQVPRKRKEKLSKAEQEELDLALKLSKETTEVSIEIPIITDDRESTTSESTVSSNENKIIEIDEQDENSLPKSKRIKREEEEEEEDDDGNESNNEEEEEEEIDEEEKEPTPRKKSIRKTEETKKNSEIPTVTSLDLNSSRLTRGQQKSSVSTSDLSKKKSNIPLGFPTSKIIIPSLKISRVGLSRKSSAIKPLHPNLNQRIVHE